MLYVLSKFGFSPNFIQLIKLIYTDPTASVYANSVSSDYFPLHRGTKQGELLSPLLFVLAIELLFIVLRFSDKIQGITRGSLTHIVSLYADDLLMYVTNPVTTIHEILRVLDNFRKISGYKFNYNKMSTFPLARMLSNIQICLSTCQLTPLSTWG